MPELKDSKAREADEISNAAVLEDYLDSPRFMEHLRQILPDHLDTDRFATIALRQVGRSPELKRCTLASVAGSVMEAATLGLEIAVNGECWLVPRQIKQDDGTREWEAGLQIGYLGHLALAYRTEKIAAVHVDVVMRGDRFDFQNGTNGYIHHKPMRGRPLDGKSLDYAYAIFETIWGGKSWQVLDRDLIERIRQSGPSANSPAWRNWYLEMAMAKALKRALKYAPKSSRLSRALTLDDQIDANVPQTFDLPLALPAEVSGKASDRVQRAMEAEPIPEREAVPAQRAQRPAPQQRAMEAEPPHPGAPPPEDQAPRDRDEPPPPGDGDAPSDLGW